jgi:hypothetical protein
MLQKPDEWQATAAIEIGKIVLSGNPELIESQGSVINRLAQPLLKRAMLQSLDGNTLTKAKVDMAQANALFQKSFISKIVRDADVVNLEVKAHSPELVKQLLSFATNSILKEHLTIQNQLIEQLTIENNQLREEHKQLGRQIQELQDLLKKQGQEHTQQYVLFLVIKNLSETRGQIESKIQNNIRSIFIMRQYTTHLMEGIVLSDGPTGPRRKMLTLAVGFISLIFMMVLCIVIELFYNFKHVLTTQLNIKASNKHSNPIE